MATNGGQTKIDMADVLREVEITVRISGFVKTMLRMKIGGWIIKFGCWIAGVTAKIDE